MRFFDVGRCRRVSKKEKSYREEGKRQNGIEPAPQILTGNAKSIASSEAMEARISWFTGSAGFYGGSPATMSHFGQNSRWLFLDEKAT
jgi:hypothetical protein